MKRSNRGLTLIEVLIASVILMVISLAIFLLIERGSSTFAQASRHASLQAQARNIVERLCEDLRVANPDTMEATNSPDPKDATRSVGFIKFQKALGFNQTINLATGKPYGTVWSPFVTYFTDKSVMDVDNNTISDDQLKRTHFEDKDDPPDGIAETLVTSKIADYILRNSFQVSWNKGAKKFTVSLTLRVADTKNRPIDATYSSTVILRNPVTTP